MLHLGGREEGKARTWPNRKQSTHMHLLMHARMHTHTCMRKGAHAPTHSHPHTHKQTHATQLHSPLEGAVYNPQLYCCHTLVHYHAQQSVSKSVPSLPMPVISELLHQQVCRHCLTLGSSSVLGNSLGVTKENNHSNSVVPAPVIIKLT